MFVHGIMEYNRINMNNRYKSAAGIQNSEIKVGMYSTIRNV